jgi:hypothetical protein
MSTEVAGIKKVGLLFLPALLPWPKQSPKKSEDDTRWLPQKQTRRKNMISRKNTNVSFL